MREFRDGKETMPFKIPTRHEEQIAVGERSAKQNAQQDTQSKTPQNGDSEMYYEIEYDSSPFPGVGKFVLKSRKAEAVAVNHLRERFAQMRTIARSLNVSSPFYSTSGRSMMLDSARIFYRQGIFMQDFEDDYEHYAPLSQYFPSYHIMGFEQLRTYFSWRTKVRRGCVEKTSLSYAFVYIYELLNNIGVKTPQEGLDRLMLFWQSFRAHYDVIDKYVIKWLKDYHIYYELPSSFKEFVQSNGLCEHFPLLCKSEAEFDRFCRIAKYDIKKSLFYTDETNQAVQACFDFVINRLRSDFLKAGVSLDDALYCLPTKLPSWKPFASALFYAPQTRRNAQVVISENEVYLCRNGDWLFSNSITTEAGKQFAGYILKQMEACLREHYKHKRKITASTGMITGQPLKIITKAGLDISLLVTSAVRDFYRETTRTVVAVDHAKLEKIRFEALLTQESLTVDDLSELAPALDPADAVKASNAEAASGVTDVYGVSAAKDAVGATGMQDGDALDAQLYGWLSDEWRSLLLMLSEQEKTALSIIVSCGDVKAFADECGIMLEVLIDGINEKAADCIGDSIIDGDFVLYDDYKEQLKELLT